ncbi:MAG: histidine kinase N-terminal 7TM domain-containing protein [Christensenellales bacterium]
MTYDIMLSIVFYICGCFYLFFGIYTLIPNFKSHINRRFLLLTLSMAAWAFAYSFSMSEPTAEAKAFWGAFSVFGWGVFYCFFLRFVLILTDNSFQFNKLRNRLLFYLPAYISIFLFAPFGYFADIQYELVPSEGGWGSFLSANIGQLWILLYSSVYIVLAVLLLIRWWRKIESHSPLKRYVSYFLISAIGPFFAGMITDVFSDVLGFYQIPRLTIVFLIFPTIFLFITLKKFGLLLERAKAEFFPKNLDNIQENRLRLLQTAAVMFTVGAAGSFFFRLFYRGKEFHNGVFTLLLCVDFGHMSIVYAVYSPKTYGPKYPLLDYQHNRHVFFHHERYV